MIILENNYFRVSISKKDGAILSLVVKKNGCEWIGENRLATAYRILAPVEGYQCNYIESSEQKQAEISQDGNTVTVTQNGMRSPRGELDIRLTYIITLAEDALIFKSSISNHSDSEIAEFWFPRIGGITQFDEKQKAGLAVPGYYQCCRHDKNLVKDYPGVMSLGAEAAEYSVSYPEMVMPWWDIYDQETDTGLYLGYHDKTMRFCTWHTYLYPNITGIQGHSMFSPEEACGEPSGLVFSHVRYPFLKNGESMQDGEFILRVHEGDWHYGSKYYRNWFMEQFPFEKKDSWLRKKSAWFTSIIYQPEDKIVADYKGYDEWCKDAEKYGVDCHELIGWDKGGLERDYPVYEPEEKIGGREGYRELLKSLHERGAKNLTFVNYNVFDSCTQWYKEELYKYTHQDTYGYTPNWMAWGESTLLARKQYGVRRHHLASIIPQTEEILEKYFLELVKDGADGFQIDKVCVGSILDFNPLNTKKPDVAMCEGMVQAIGRLWEKCREINPEFRMASEFCQDRLLPYFDIGYRNAAAYTISPLRYVFPEWTACQHISNPLDFELINSSVMTGAVICMEPFCYQGSMNHPLYRRMSKYIEEVERIRTELKDIIFLGEYGDDLFAVVSQTDSQQKNVKREERVLGGEVMVPGGVGSSLEGTADNLQYRTHRSLEGDRLAIVIANCCKQAVTYTWKVNERYQQEAVLYTPFAKPRKVYKGEILKIPGIGLHILVTTEN